MKQGILVFLRMLRRKLAAKIATIIALLGLSILLVWFAGSVSATDGRNKGRSSEKVNLALRRTAHYLLQAAGDSTSRIPPVQQTTDHTWVIRMEHAFNYDTLPALLQASFDLHGIEGNYDVAVLRCLDNELQVGYSYLDYIHNKNAPCGGRDMPSDCYVLKIDFPEPMQENDNWAGWVLALAGLVMLAVFFLSRRRSPTAQPEKSDSDIEAAGWLHFGGSRLDTTGYRLVCGDKVTQLTFRESKLLALFAARPNQLLNRDFIIENVWADEGVLVGRSLDMFVSRLRKKLHADPSLGIVAVHGVGYRMEVS